MMINQRSVIKFVIIRVITKSFPQVGEIFSWRSSKRLEIGNTNVIGKIKDEKQILSKKVLFLKVVYKIEMIRIKVRNNVLISL